VSKVYDCVGLFPVVDNPYRRVELVEALSRKAPSSHPNDLMAVISIVRNFRKDTERENAEVITGPRGVNNWLGLPFWVQLKVWPDDYEVRERVSPLVQELIWAGVDKVKAKGWERKAPKKKGLDVYERCVNRVSDWPSVMADDSSQRDGVVIRSDKYRRLVALDFETDGGWLIKAKPTCLSVSDGDGMSICIYDQTPDDRAVVMSESLDRGKALWDQIVGGYPNVIPVVHQANSDFSFAKGLGWNVPTDADKFEDTLLMAFSAGEKWTDDKASLGLKVLQKKYLHTDRPTLTDFIPAARLKKMGTLGADVNLMSYYGQQDSKGTVQLPDVLRDKVVENIYTLEKSLVSVVMDMEEAGFPLDPEVLQRLSVSAAFGKSQILQWMRDAGLKIDNVNSNPQCASVIYDQCGLQSSFGRSTGKEAMQELWWHPVAKRLRSWRILDSLEGEADALLAQFYEGGIAYTTFNQAGGSTGRFSSSNPINLQNKTGTLRKAFVSGDVQQAVFRADYAQIELRIAATLAQDEAMLGAIREGRSLHRDLHASLVNDAGLTWLKYDQVKTFDFSLFYGGDVERIRTVLNCDKETAHNVMKAVEDKWYQAMAWRNDILHETQDNGGVNFSMIGRKFLYPLLFTDDLEMRGHTERTVVNKPIQGTGADCIKLAMQQGHFYLKRKYGAQVRLTVHDELTGTVPWESIEEFKADLREIMLEVEPRVPLDVEIGFGNNWLGAKH